MIIEQINDICLELTDSGFYSFGRNKVEIASYTQVNSQVSIFKAGGYYFEDVKEVLYRIKDLVGIENIKSCAFMIEDRLNGPTYVKCDLSELNNESFEESRLIISCRILFNFHHFHII